MENQIFKFNECISLLDDDFYFFANESSDNGSIIQPKKNEIHKIKRHSWILIESYCKG